MKKLLALVILLFSFSSIAQDDNTLVVDAFDDNVTISPYVYGANFGPLQVVTVDLQQAAIDSGINILRFPGGRWGDLNDIRTQQIDMFIRLCEQIGAEPLIHVRLENGTPEAAAELVRYTNIEKEYGVVYWSIGNEPNLFDDYTTEDLNREWRPIAEAMLEVDPDILLVGPDISQYNGADVNPRDSEGREWLREFLRVNGDMIDIVSVHRYPFPLSMANPVTTIEDLRQNAPEWSNILPAMRETVLETTGRASIPVAVTEANSHWSANIGGEATPDSFYNAVWWADALGRLIQGQPYFVNYFDFQSFDDRGGWGLLSRYDVRPTYYTYQLYRMFGTSLIETHSPDDDVTIYGAFREDGALTLMIVNLTDEEQTRALQINGFEPSADAEVWRLDADHNAEQIDSITLGDTLTVPPQSVTLLVVP